MHAATERITHQAPSPSAVRQPLRSVTPPVDIFENDDAFVVAADLPGVRDEDVDITLEHKELVLRAKRELSNGRFLEYRRAFRITDAIDGAAIDAKLAHGVLTVRLPKAEAVKPRKIAVKAG